jgi:hypothetical protein
MSAFIRFISVALLLSFIGCARFGSVPKTTAFDADPELREAYLQEYRRAGILNSKVPEEGKQIAYEHLKKSGPGFLEMPLKELTLSDPHEFCFIDLDVIANGKLLSEARLSSWQYHVLRKKRQSQRYI